MTSRKENYSKKFKKCKFWLDQIEFLGHIMIAKGIEVDLNKIEAITNWQRLANFGDMRSFLGLVGYY